MIDALSAVWPKDVHICTTERRMSRKAKKALKKSLWEPNVRKIIVHTGRAHDDAYDAFVTR